MLFESVSASAFGPFHGETLSFAPGMNVVHGPNEAGKSTWHAALYAGLCGVCHNSGTPGDDDRAFEERHRPWDGDGDWKVGAVVSLADGRRVELRQDLGGVVSSVQDADVAGRDYSDEIMKDGAPDGSVWLGLDRRSFVSTACVRQADVLGLLDQTRIDGLQEQLRRAAANFGTDATAARALELLRDYHSEHIGSESAEGRPLQATRARVTGAEQELESVHAVHRHYIERRGRVDGLEDEFRALERRAGAATIVLARARVEQIEMRLQSARELSDRFQEGPPRGSTEEDRLTRQVADALQAWRSLPEPPGAALAALEQELLQIEPAATAASLPELPEVEQRTERSVGWVPPAAAAAAAAGGGLAFAGLVVPGVALFGLAIVVLAWRIMARRLEGPGVDQLATSALFERAGRRSAIEQRIEELREARKSEEDAYRESRRQRDQVATLLREASFAAGVEGVGPEEHIVALRAWEEDRQQALDDAALVREQWDELQRLLSDGSLDEQEAEVSRLRKESDALAAASDAGELAKARAEDLSHEEFRALERQVSEANDAWVEAQAGLAQFGQDLPSMVDAEEERAAAREDLERVESLDRTLRQTIEFVDGAERAYRDIAPLLRETILEWLPVVTNGRYSDCRVDPQTLELKVRGENGLWRQAELLSHGTAEQLYLLLRLALARHLTLPGEVSPLILDEVVSSGDGERKQQLLETLHTLSESTQVILFSHEPEVLEWAQKRLQKPQDRLVTLDPANLIR